jgi:hypothetical protein
LEDQGNSAPFGEGMSTNKSVNVADEFHDVSGAFREIHDVEASASNAR